MRRIAHDTGKKKRPARTAWPERRGFSKFLRHASGRGNAEIRQIIPADAFGSRGNSAQAGNRQAASSGRKVHPAGKPPGQARRRKIPIGGLCPPFSLQQVSPPGPAPTRQEANAPPAGTPTEALRPGPGTRRADTALSHRETCSARLRVLCMCPPPTGKRLLRFPAGKAAAFSPCLPGREQKKALQEDEVRLKAAGL